MSETYRIGKYYTNVDLANGLTANLVETELALQHNPGQFDGIILFDQAKGKDVDPEQRLKLKGTAFATGWNGVNTDADGGFHQPIWTKTGIARIQPSKIAPDNLEQLARIAQLDRDKYANYLVDNLIRTGSSNSGIDYYRYYYGEDAENPLVFNLGISTDFSLLDEMQTGSPASVDYFLSQSNSDSLYNSNPHALFFSNHGASYLSGNNGDGPKYDNDSSEQYLQVTELSESLNRAISTYSPGKGRFGLIAYDECLMANIETVTQLRDVTRYLLASQETIPGNGFDYFLSLSSFQTKGPLATQEQIEDNSRELALGFVNTYNERNPGPRNTLSLTDTDAITALNQAIRQYADALVNSDDKYILALLKGIKLKGTDYDYKWLQDLGNIVLISKSTPGASQEIIDASTTLLEHLDKAIVANNQSYRPIEGYLENASSGLTITLPTRFDQWVIGSEFIDSPSDKFITQAPAFEAQTGWSRVIDRIYPLLLAVQTKTVTEPTKAQQVAGTLTAEEESSAWGALQINGYLISTSNDARINRYTHELPLMENTTVSDLVLDFNVLELREIGSVTVTIEDSNGQAKASWTEQVDGEGSLEFSAETLPLNEAAQPIKDGDRIVLTPDNTVSARYDLGLTIANQKLGLLNTQQTEVDSSSLLNFSLGSNESQEIKLQTSVLPPASNGEPGSFFTEIVLLSSEEGGKRLTITEAGGASISFSTDVFIDEFVALDAETTYTFLVEDMNTTPESANVLSSDIALLIDIDASPSYALRDAIFELDISVKNWGAIKVEQNVVEAVPLAELNSSKRIANIDDLTEGHGIDGSVSIQRVNNQSLLRKSADGGNQTFASGVWTATGDISLSVFIEGKGANSARLGFFEVDTITGAINTTSGLIAPNNDQSYINAAIDNLVSPMVTLDGFSKEGTLELKLVAAKSYAALLIAEDGIGNATALFSLANANPTKDVQFLSFGDGYFGFEDLIKGRNSGYDGDFNDITFYTS